MEDSVQKPIKESRSSQPLAATTTEQQDITREGQRKINLIWERTQAKIALTSVISWVVISGVVIGAMLFAERDINATKMAVITAALSSISLTVGIIIGFYFSRTNHSAIGGIGEKDKQSTFGTR